VATLGFPSPFAMTVGSCILALNGYAELTAAVPSRRLTGGDGYHTTMAIDVCVAGFEAWDGLSIANLVLSEYALGQHFDDA
jgi:hypothetical protein